MKLKKKTSIKEKRKKPQVNRVNLLNSQHASYDYDNHIESKLQNIMKLNL